MTALATRSHRRSLSSAGLKRIWWRHPEIPALTIAAGAWAYLAIDHWASHGTEQPWSFRPLPWAAMVLAMMVPAAAPMVRVVSFDSMWRRRLRAPALFLATYVLAWAATGAAVALAVFGGERLTGRSFEPGAGMVVGLLVVAAAWQFSPSKVRFLRRCHQRTPLAPRGWKADRSVIVYGLVHTRACIGSCGFAMAAMFASVHAFHLMVPLSVMLWVERWQPRPKPHLGGYAIAVLAGVTFVTEVVA